MADRLLIVDDEAPIRYALRDYFVAAGYEVDCARTCAEAILALDAHLYAGVIADLRLDDPERAEGLDVVRSARELNAGTSIIVLTAYGSPEVAAEAFRRGADAFLDKPVPLPEIARMLVAVRQARAGTADP